MKTLASKKSSRRNSIQKKSIQDVPRVQIFLDAHLTRAINSLKIQKLSKPNINQQQCLQSSRKYKILNSQIQHDKDPTLINNDIVINYIRQVYNKYNITDPLEDNFDFPMIESYQTYRTQKKNRKISINQKKIIDLKNKFRCQIDELEQTAKKIQTPTHNKYKNYENSQMNVFDFQNDTTLQQSQQVSPQKQESQRKKILLKVNKKRQNSEYILFDKKFPSQNFKKRKTLSRPLILQENLDQEGYSKRNNKVDQLFRYCFMCEQYILHANITFHQNSCLKLQKAYKLPLKEIQAILQKKIQNLKNEVVNGNFMKMQQQNIFKIKSSIREWIQSLEKHQTQKQNNDKKYQKVFDSINKDLLEPYNSIHKLQWFIRLRENIKKRLLSFSL